MSASRKWIGKTLKWVGIVVATAIVAGVSIAIADSNGVGPKSTRCVRVLTEVISSVPGVVDVEVHCSFRFGYSLLPQVVRLNAADEAQSLAIVEQVYRALAADARVDDVWPTPSSFRYAGDRELLVVGTALGFTSPNPDVWVVRKNWGITPK